MVVGTYDGRVIFFSTDQLKYHTTIHVQVTLASHWSILSILASHWSILSELEEQERPREEGDWDPGHAGGGQDPHHQQRLPHPAVRPPGPEPGVQVQGVHQRVLADQGLLLT